jgi:hypothetical protein
MLILKEQMKKPKVRAAFEAEKKTLPRARGPHLKSE